MMGAQDQFDPVLEDIKRWWNSVAAKSWAFDESIGQPLEWTPKRNPRVVTASANVNPLDDVILIDATATMTLSTAVASDGRPHMFVVRGAGTTLTVACTGSQTVGGAATKVTSTRYAGFMVKSDGVNWQVIQMDAAAIVGILGIANGGTGNTTGTATINANLTGGVTSVGNAATVVTNANLTGPVTSVGNATTIVAPTYPLMSWNGKKFNGTTDYLTANALTGIADSKVGTMVIFVRFGQAVTATAEILVDSKDTAGTAGAFRVDRVPTTGHLRFQARNTADASVLNQRTSGAELAAAGTYALLYSWNMDGTGVTAYIGNTATVINTTTFTSGSTLDNTVTSHSIGATTAGSLFELGDIYAVWFDSTAAMDFTVEANRRKFIDSNNVPIFLGANGELPTGTSPILFLGYDKVARWKNNRGTATSTFTENGTPAEVTTTLYGQYARLAGNRIAWTPTRTGWTDVGAATVTAYYIEMGSVCYIEVKIVPGTTTATVAGTSYINLPIPVNATGISGVGVMENLTTLIAVGTCAFDATNGRFYMPTQGATANTLTIAGSYPI